MKLLDYILFPVSLAFFVMGIYESMVLGISHAYVYFMVSLAMLFLYGYRKNQRKPKN